MAGLALGLGAAAPQGSPAFLSDSRLAAVHAGPEALAASEDHSTRLTIPVTINGAGPYHFVVDTGANRTVISRELAARLRLSAGPHIPMDDALGKVDMETVFLDHLQVGSREIRGIDAPILPAASLGADGMLGIDSLHNQHVVMEFDEKRFLIGESAEDADAFDLNTTVVRGRRRFGQLVLVDAESQAVPIFVILDSGAQNTIGNEALRRLMTFGPPLSGHLPIDILISVTGRHARAELDRMPEIQFSGIKMQNVPIAYADLHTFTQFGLDDRPALLLGMDVLHIFRRVGIDFRRREVVFVTH